MDKKIIIVGIVIILVLALGGWFWMSQRETPLEDQSIEETFVTEEPELDEEIEFEKSDFSIQVLNGSGKRGLAGEVEKELEDEGYTIGATAGNADNPNYQNTIIRAKSDVPQGFIDILKADLSNYGTVEIEELDEDADVDVVIILGGQQEKAESTPTPTPAEEDDEEEDSDEAE